MKYILRIIPYVIILFFLGCQEDSFKEIQNEEDLSKSPYTMRIINTKEIQENSMIQEKLESFSRKKTHVSENEIYNEEYNFTVNTDYAKYIESEAETLHSYTFLIKRDQYTGSVENLVFSSLPDGTYNTSIVVYDFTNVNEVEIKIAKIENLDTLQYLPKSYFTIIVSLQ